MSRPSAQSSGVRYPVIGKQGYSTGRVFSRHHHAVYSQQSRSRYASQPVRQVDITVSRPSPMVTLCPRGSSIVPENLDSLPILEALLSLLNRVVIPSEKSGRRRISGLRACFGYFLILTTFAPSSASAPKPRRSKRVLPTAEYYATLAGVNP